MSNFSEIYCILGLPLFRSPGEKFPFLPANDKQGPELRSPSTQTTESDEFVTLNRLAQCVRAGSLESNAHTTSLVMVK